MTTKRAVIYVRVSDPGQAEEELSIPSQVERCQAKARELDATVVRVFADEGKSGRLAARPEFQQAIAYCENFPTDYLITWSTSRFARNKLDAAMHKLRLENAGTQIVYVSQTIDRDDDTGWLTESIFEVFDELQSRMIAKDTRRSMETNARAGHWNGGRAPFGYRAIPDPANDKRRRLVPDDEEAAVVRRIFDLRLAGLGARAIAIQLNQAGIKNRTSRWNKQSVVRLLHNQSVIGCIVFGRRRGHQKRLQPREKWIVVQSHEPIVDRTKFDAVQALLADADTTTGEASSLRSTFVFTGMLRCGRCGGAMTTSSATGRSKVYHYYNCRNAMVGNTCKNRRIAARDLDAWLVDLFLQRIFTREKLEAALLEIKRDYGTWARDQKRRRRLILRKIEEAQAKRLKLFEVLELHGKGAPNLGDITTRLREHNETIRGHETELAALEAERQPELEIDEDDVRDLVGLFEGVIKTSDNPKRLRQFFALFVSKIEVRDREISIEYRPDRLLATGAVRSTEQWLPGRSVLRTGPVASLVVELPTRFARAA